MNGRLAFPIAGLAGALLIMTAADRPKDAAHPSLDYPEARRGDVVDDYHGTMVADPYRWMEDLDSEETRAWIEAQVELFNDYISKVPERDRIEDRLTALWDYEKYGVPFEEGRRYFLYVTTLGGLYRYDMNDIVQVDGCYQRVPRLRFVQKGKGVTNISGEKLYESQVIAAVSKVEAAYGVGSSFYLMLADEERSRYELLFEPDPDSGRMARERALQIARDVDAALAGINVEYAAKRRSGRIGDLELALLAPGTFERFKRACLEGGQREGQFKIVALQYRRDLDFDFRAEMGAVPVGRTAAGL